MKCVIIASGNLEYNEHIKKTISASKLIICADGGAGHLRRMNLLPHVIIGDFDSLSTENQAYFADKGIQTISFPEKKDKTDSDLCLSFALEKGATDIILLGVTGTRMDHTLANIMMMEQLAPKKISATIIDSHNEIHFVTNTIELCGTPGDFLSLIPVSEKVTGVFLSGLEYQMENGCIKRGSSLGISNRFKNKTATIKINSGSLLVIKSKD